MRIVLAFMMALSLWGCGETIPAQNDDTPQVLIMGDSLMAWNRVSGQQVARALAAELGVGVADHSVIGARHFYILPTTGAAGLRMSAQYRGGPYKWVVLNGGGNDLLFGCGCGPCTGTLNRLISADGRSGAIPELVARARADGARVIHTGYMRTRGVDAPVKGCRPLGDEMDKRLARMAARDAGVTFVTLADIVEVDGDTSLHSADLVHPSAKGSAAIAARIARVIRGK